MEISVIFDEGIEEDESPAAEWLKSIIEKVLAAEGADASSEVSLLITGQERIHELNREYLDEDRPTDVLSFPMLPEVEGTEFVSPPDGMSHLGEIVISLPQATIQAKERGHSRERELAILIIHGVLHLLGYDHDIEERESLMQGREQDILGSLNTNSAAALYQALVPHRTFSVPDRYRRRSALRQNRRHELKVLGIAGSPRRNGNTDMMLAEFMKGASGKGAETKTLFLRDLDISTCQHCDACLKAGICKIKDDIQQAYIDMQGADVIVMASPVQFTGVTAQMKAFIDRCQSLWAKKYVLKVPPLGDRRERKGFFISVGGRKVPNLFDPMLIMIKTFFRIIDVKYAGELLFSGVDEKGAIAKHPDALRLAFEAGQKLAEGTPQAEGQGPISPPK